MDNSQRLAPHQRLLAACAALVLAVPIVAATRISPDPRGWGTHEQLGWAPCRIRQWWGRPCPTCGMTTAWAYAVRGNAQAAVEANLGGAVLLGLAACTAVWAAASALAGRWLVVAPTPRQVLTLAALWLAVTLAHWLWRLAAG